MIGMAGCTADLSKPNCGWANQIPHHDHSICNLTYATLRRVTAAEADGDNSEIHRLVPAPNVARRIIGYGSSLRRQGLSYLRTTPLLVLTARPHQRVIVLAYLVGKTSGGKIDASETITVHVHRVATIVGDQPGQEW